MLPKHQAARQRRVENAIRRSARRGVAVVKSNVPVAFGELRESIEAQATDGGAKIVADAPHAEAIELGTRPHWVPLDALVKWVKLRGMQGLASDRQLTRLPGTTTYRHARSVAAELASAGDGTMTPTDAPLEIAKRIQLAIAHRGTKPHWYMQQSQSAVMTILDEEIQKALPEKEG